MKCDGTTIFQRRLPVDESTPDELQAARRYCLFTPVLLSSYLAKKPATSLGGRLKRRKRRSFDDVATGCCSAAAEGEGPGLEAAQYAEQVWSRQAADAQTNDGDGAYRGHTKG